MLATYWLDLNRLFFAGLQNSRYRAELRRQAALFPLPFSSLPIFIYPALLCLTRSSTSFDELVHLSRPSWRVALCAPRQRTMAR
ncbi:hypothetical protein Y032_0233g3114 [Ancylostoma ceylanicum]|uniref:Uncharacterized protein n=1 Tax=Ancylostoma ceylanicum TaxID=53326 RepID=A0A016SG27_9BILA|nr:hypothetical protein Y032_0233g3114 [Ancylostoma ceylanicum]